MPHQPPPSEDLPALLTPTNTLLLLLTLTLLYLRLRPRPPPTIPVPTPLVYTYFTPTTLTPYNGLSHPSKSVYLAVNRKVYDVTPGSNFYGPGGPYENFAGRDASRGLAKGSFEAEMVVTGTVDEEGKVRGIDGLEDLGEVEREALREWERHFEGKYRVVGELVEEGEEVGRGE
ncbi:cytochrome b5-like heme/steroid binding domain-containing protein [Peziza echinospora]|nr:cytochrome b5-like heme/steroid binding domain-containing protein [Peziza echinospora]